MSVSLIVDIKEPIHDLPDDIPGLRLGQRIHPPGQNIIF